MADLEDRLIFKDVSGIRYYEVKRRFKNGLSFNKDGFQQEPTWIIEPKAPDSMLAYSPEKDKMESFFLLNDHDNIYNFAKEFFRAKVITKDSLLLQRLQVDGKIIANDDDIRSDVYCTYYSKDYIEKKLRTTAKELQKPSKADTAFIKNLVQQTYRDPSSSDFAFAARNPVQFIPKGDFITVEKLSSRDENSHTSTMAYDYLYPEYKIVILRSYRDFANRIRVVVDANGKMYVKSVDFVERDLHEAKRKLLQGIVDVYLKNLLIIKPGTTLGIPHSSYITINVVGRAIK